MKQLVKILEHFEGGERREQRGESREERGERREERGERREETGESGERGSLGFISSPVSQPEKENALYGFALRRSWSTVSGRTLPGSLSFHMRAVLEAAPKTKSRDYIFNLCHEVIVALFMNNALRIPPIGSMSMSNIFDGYLEMVRH